MAKRAKNLRVAFIDGSRNDLPSQILEWDRPEHELLRVGLTATSAFTAEVYLREKFRGNCGSLAKHDLNSNRADEWRLVGGGKDLLHIKLQLRPATTYEWYVKTIAVRRGVNDVATDIETFTTMDHRPFSAPTRVSVASATRDSLQLQWSPPTIPNGTLTKYTIYFAVRGSTKHFQIAVAEVVHTREGKPSSRVNDDAMDDKPFSFVLGNLFPGTEYNIQVSAWTCAGEGPVSNIVVGSTLAAIHQLTERRFQSRDDHKASTNVVQEDSTVSGKEHFIPSEAELAWALGEGDTSPADEPRPHRVASKEQLTRWRSRSCTSGLRKNTPHNSAAHEVDNDDHPTNNDSSLFREIANNELLAVTHHRVCNAWARRGWFLCAMQLGKRRDKDAVVWIFSTQQPKSTPPMEGGETASASTGRTGVAHYAAEALCKETERETALLSRGLRFQTSIEARNAALEELRRIGGKMPF